MNNGPLTGLRVFDLSRILAGPTCTQLLGDLGADVIKVERPGAGDDTRTWGPPYLKDQEGADTSESAYYLSCNRNKRSITIDIESAEGQALAHRLIQQSDILVENFKVGGLARYGLAWEQIHAAYPRLIYCSITGFGQTGPYAARAGYDYLVQGMGGIMSVTGDPEGQPMKVGTAVSDVSTGLHATIAILAALHHRERTGRGQRIDLALLDATVALTINQGLNYLTSGRPPGRLGNAHPNIVPYQVFRCLDGHVILAVGNDSQYRKFCAFAGVEPLAEDPRFLTNGDRVRNRAFLIPQLEPLFEARTVAYWIEGLEPLGVPCSPINRMDEVFADPQVLARDMLVEMEHPASGAVKLIGNPQKFSDTPVEYRLPPPMLGEHTDEILGEIGLDAAEIAALRAKKVV